MNFNPRDHLRRQLGFLERSTAAFDAGYRDEAIRMATTIRVLLHDTRKSTSLLTHFGATNINLLSTVKEISERVTYFVGMGAMQSGEDAEIFFPLLEKRRLRVLVPVSKWWSQIVCVLNPQTKLTRGSIVLAAANKDGGTHVDASLTPEYAKLAADGTMGTRHRVIDDKVVEIEKFRGAHYVFIREITYELLNSPALWALADG